MDFTKLVKAALDSPHQELSGCGLGFVVALTVFQEIIFFVCSYWKSDPAVGFIDRP